MSIKLSELEKCLEKVMDLARWHGLSEIELEREDLYWTVLSGDWMDFEKDPDPGVGSLVDDIAYLKRLSSGENPPTSVDLDRIAAVFQLLSERIAGC